MKQFPNVGPNACGSNTFPSLKYLCSEMIFLLSGIDSHPRNDYFKLLFYDGNDTRLTFSCENFGPLLIISKYSAI